MSQQINDNFSILAGLPLDDRNAKTTIGLRDAIPATLRFEGLLCYVSQTSTLYQLQGGIENSNWIGIAGNNVTSDFETEIEGFLALSAGKTTLNAWEVGDKFRGWIGNRYVVGSVVSLPVSLPSDIDDASKVSLEVDSDLPVTYATVVYVNSSDPNTATIFDSENPPITDNPSLESDTDNLYIADDASTWIYNGSVYVTKTVTSETSNFYISGTSTDAGSSKTGHIYRIGKTSIGADVISEGVFNVFTGTSGLGLDLAIQPSGVIGFYNNATSLATPTMAGKSTNSIGLSLMSATNNSNPTDSDMEFNARRDNGEDFSTLTSTAFRFKRFGTALVDILRNGNTGFGTMNPQAKIDINSAINEPSIAVAGFPVMRYSTGDVLDIGAFGSTWSAIRLLSGGAETITMSGGSASLKNTPTAPTAAPGSTGNQIANLDFVLANSMALSGNQTFTGFKTGTSTNSTPTGLTLTNEVTTTGSFVVDLYNSVSAGTNSTGAIRVTNSNTGGATSAVQIVNSSTGLGSFLKNISTGKGQYSENVSTGVLAQYNSLTASTGDLINFSKQGVLTAKIDQNGEFTVPKLIATGVVRLKNYTVATLPAGTQGDTAYVTDALAPTSGAVVVGGGAVVCPVFYDGTNWTRF